MSSVEGLKQKYNGFLERLAGDIERNDTEDFNRRIDEIILEVKTLIRKNELE